MSYPSARGVPFNVLVTDNGPIVCYYPTSVCLTYFPGFTRLVGVRFVLLWPGNSTHARPSTLNYLMLFAERR